MQHIDEFLVSEGGDVVWELYHENSKTSRAEPHPFFTHHPADSTVIRVMRGLRQVKPYADREKVALPEDEPSPALLDDVLLGRESARGFGPGSVGIAELAAVLRRCQGVTRDNDDNDYPRPFRVVPSGGALYPLEIYVWARDVAGLEAGLYHYDPLSDELDVLGPRDLSPAFVQRDLVETAPVVLLVSAVFFRTVFKYGERGYRFALLEAGHLVQNALLASAARGLASVPVGGYFDRELDRALGIDGLHESVLYTVLLGGPEAP
jgi:SagB-type dehydrogenase family enzyme